jgi:hypothetical protein
MVAMLDPNQNAVLLSGEAAEIKTDVEKMMECLVQVTNE